MDRASNKQKLRIGFILAPRFTLIAFSGFIDALRLAADEGDRSQRIHCDWAVLGIEAQPITSSCGVSVLPTANYGSPEEFDYIVVVGGLLHGGQRVPKRTIQYLKNAALKKINLIGLCTGSFILARAGLLDGYLSCVSWFHREEFIQEFPNTLLTSSQMFVVDRDRMTCAGGTSVVHLAAHIIEKKIGRAMAVKALRVMLEDQPLPSRTLQPEPVLTSHSKDPIVHKAMLLIEQNMRDQKPVSNSFAFLGVGKRQLERRFLRDVGISPAQYRTLLRVQRAEQLLKSSDISITDIALESGFQDASQLARTLKKLKGASPTQLRAQLHTNDK